MPNIGVRHIENTRNRNFSIQGRRKVKNGISKTVAIKIINGPISIIYKVKYRQFFLDIQVFIRECFYKAPHSRTTLI